MKDIDDVDVKFNYSVLINGIVINGYKTITAEGKKLDLYSEEVIKWYKLVNQVFEKHNIGRAAWSYKKMNFGLADSWIDSKRDELLKLL